MNNLKLPLFGKINKENRTEEEYLEIIRTQREIEEKRARIKMITGGK